MDLRNIAIKEELHLKSIMKLLCFILSSLFFSYIFLFCLWHSSCHGKYFTSVELQNWLYMFLKDKGRFKTKGYLRWKVRKDTSFLLCLIKRDSFRVLIGISSRSSTFNGQFLPAIIKWRNCDYFTQIVACNNTRFLDRAIS